MKLFSMAAASVCMLILCGCMAVSEPDAPALTSKFSADAMLHPEGFQLYSVREKQHHAGNSYFTAYNFKTGSWSFSINVY